MSELTAIKREIKGQAVILGALVALLWVLEGADQLLGHGLLAFGVIPRTAVGLRGLLFAPFLHVSFAHLMANTVPLVVLGWLIMLRETRDFFAVWAASSLAGGLGIWLVAPSPSVHVGASIVVFGFLGYLLARGWFERKLASIAVAVVVGVLYGGALFGVLPGQAGISWQGHLFGFAGGVLAARWMSGSRWGRPPNPRPSRPATPRRPLPA